MFLLPSLLSYPCMFLAITVFLSVVGYCICYPIFVCVMFSLLSNLCLRRFIISYLCECHSITYVFCNLISVILYVFVSYYCIPSVYVCHVITLFLSFLWYCLCYPICVCIMLLYPTGLTDQCHKNNKKNPTNK